MNQYSPPILLASLSPGAVKWLLGVWVFALGGAIGSFLNVVVYRLPAGKSLSRPGSRCPVCTRPIRWYDNVPIFAWVWLRGRCRDCGAPISPRYPIVEAITAGLFLTLGVTEGFSGGANLPARSHEIVDGVVRAVAYTPDELAGLVGYHLLLLCTLLCAALIEYDGNRVPARLVVPALLAGSLAPLLWPHLHPVPAWPGSSGAWAGAADGTAGLAWGLLLGLAAWRWCGANENLGLPMGLACVGSFLGWQAVTVLAAISVAIHFMGRVPGIPGRRPEIPTTWLTVTTLAWILAWNPLCSRWPPF